VHHQPQLAVLACVPELIFPLDSNKRFTDQAEIGHNRWHPEIPPVAWVKPGHSFRSRESALRATDPLRVPPLALPPEPRDAVLGSVPPSEFDRIAAEAARTAPPRENGGNQDIKNLTKGSRVFYPVFVSGANLSVGDGAAPIEGRLSGVVDILNSCATVYLPIAIFDFDVRPGASGPARVPQGTSTPHASFG
jgi:acetamidase/formamidase